MCARVALACVIGLSVAAPVRAQGDRASAIKASAGKYLVSQLLNIAQSINPIRSATDTRTWTDLDGNGSALDSGGNAQYNEIGVSGNWNFGVLGGSTRFDPDAPRPTNWEENIQIQQEIVPRVAVTAATITDRFRTSR